MSTISTYTNLIKIFGEELDTSDKEAIKTIIINIMSALDISIVPTEILTMVDEERRKELLQSLSDIIYFGDEENGQIIDASGETICNLHQEAIDPDVLIPLSSSLIRDGIELKRIDNQEEINSLLAVIDSVSSKIDPMPLTLARLKSQALLLAKREHNISSTINRNIRTISQILLANEQLRDLLNKTSKEKESVEETIRSIENQSVKVQK